MNEYTLYEYSLNGQTVVSAIHWRDGAKFREEHPEAKPIRQMSVVSGKIVLERKEKNVR